MGNGTSFLGGEGVTEFRTVEDMGEGGVKKPRKKWLRPLWTAPNDCRIGQYFLAISLPDKAWISEKIGEWKLKDTSVKTAKAGSSRKNKKNEDIYSKQM